MDRKRPRAAKAREYDADELCSGIPGIFLLWFYDDIPENLCLFASENFFSSSFACF